MSKPLCILDLITTAQGGKRLLEYRVSQINKDPDFKDYLVCPEDPYFTGGFEDEGIPFISMPMSRGLGLLSTLREILNFLHLLRSLRPDVVHAHTSKAGAVSRIASALHNLGRKERVYVCYQVHSFYFNALTGLKRRIFFELERFLSSLSDALLFQNETELRQAREAGMDKKALLMDIGNGINLREFQAPKGPRTPADWKDPKDRPFTFICIARVEPKKNHRMLVEAARLLRDGLEADYGLEKALRSFKVLCVGEIGEESALHYAKNLGLDTQVFFTGVKNRQELKELLELSDVSILSSTAEGKPRALMESMYLGIPCVATEVCGTMAVVDHGETGFLVPLNDAAAFATALRRLMEDDVLYSRFSEASMARARRDFDDDAVIERLKELYRRRPVQVNNHEE